MCSVGINDKTMIYTIGVIYLFFDKALMYDINNIHIIKKE